MAKQEAYHSRPSSANIKNVYAFTMWCLIKLRDNYAFLYVRTKCENRKYKYPLWQVDLKDVQYQNPGNGSFYAPTPP